MSDVNRPLKMVTCPGCDAKTFIPGDLPPLASEPCKKCGHAIMMPMLLRQFELRAKVGSGGMAIVYRAWDTMLERFVAVKLMKKEILAEANARENFLREARSCAKLNLELLKKYPEVPGIHCHFWGFLPVIAVQSSMHLNWLYN